MKDVKEFLIKYRGAIIGGLFALLILLLRLHIVLIWLAILVLGIVIGNYIQNNKEFVKDKLKYFIDRM